MSSDKLQRNKENAKAFYSLMFNDDKPTEAIEKYAGAEYIQHNPHVPDGKKGFIEYFENISKKYPGKKVYFKREIAEDNYVVLHCYQTWPGFPDYASIDIFRFDDDGKIVEHWDTLQTIPEKFAHDNGMF